MAKTPERELKSRKEYYFNYYSQYLGEGQTLEKDCEALFGVSYEDLLKAGEEASLSTVKTELVILLLSEALEIAPTEEQLSAYVLGLFEHETNQYYGNVESFVTVSLGYEGADYFYLRLLNQMLLQKLYDLAVAA